MKRRELFKTNQCLKFSGILLIVVSLIIILCACSGADLSGEGAVTERQSVSLNETNSSEMESSPISNESQETQPDESTTFPERYLPDGSSLEVHFIDVGQGDSILALCEGEAMLIDGGNPESSSLIYSYLRQREIDHLKYIICTHPDEDHVGGLPGALNYAVADRAFCSEPEYDTRAFQSFLKYLDQQGIVLEVPAPGMHLTLGNAVGTICGPLSSRASSNDNSLVIKLQLGDVSFLFTGDAEEREEDEMIAAGGLKSTVLKVAHHGSNNATSDRFLKAVDPEYAVISCGAYNSYGHPTDGVLNRLKAQDLKLFRTDMQGDIICKTDGKEISFSVEKNPDANTFQTYYDLYGKERGKTLPNRSQSDVSPAAQEYVLNKRSKKFHYPDCRSVNDMSETNRKYVTESREELIAKGYEPCGNCHP